MELPPPPPTPVGNISPLYGDITPKNIKSISLENSSFSEKGSVNILESEATVNKES